MNTTTNNNMSVAGAAIRWVRSWAAELAVAAVIITVIAYLGRAAGTATAHILLVGAFVTVLACPPGRGWLAGLLGRRARKRRWRQALAGIVAEPAAPTLLAYRDDPTGSWAQVRTGPGGTITELETRTEPRRA
jgi:hypothetical protein